MRVNVTEQGLIIPKEFLTGIQAVEIRRDRDHIILTPSAETAPAQRKDMFGIWQEQIWMVDDFDAPLDDFEEYI
jgi:virulence-associated protein VagC